MLQSLIHSLKTRKRYRRSAMVVAVGAIALGLVSQVAAPYLISTSLVRNGMEEAVEQWFGHEATIEGAPELHFWPHPHIILKDVSIRETEDPASRLIAHVDNLSASFELFQALRGNLVFEDFDLVRPKLFALRTASGDIDWSMDGLLNDAVKKVRSNAGNTAIGKDLDAAIGEVTIEDGSVEISDANGQHKTSLTAVNGTVEWPQLSSAISSRLTGTLRDKTFTLSFSSAKPLTLLAGRNADADLSLSSDLFSGQFSGTANLATYAFLAGSFSINMPRVPDILNWLDIHVTGLDRLNQLSLKGQMMTAGNALRFEQVSLQANEASATGIMDLVASDGARPRLTGTLAFDKLNFSAIIAALSPQPQTAGQDDVTPAALLGDLLDLDLRLSATEAQLGPLPLRNAAVSLINTHQMARVDLVDSSIDGGRLTGQISAPEGRLTDSADLRLSLRDVDLASVSRRFGVEAIVPEANGSAELALHLAKPLGLATMSDLSGSLRLSARNGRLNGIDLAAIRQLAGQSAYFALKDVSDGDILFDRMDISATIADGVAELGEARLDGPSDLIVLSGLVPLETQGLALSANIYAETDGTPSNDPLMMFIGGAWPTPVFWPMAKPPQP
ncbi:AsmA-like C-terminal region-containing protein [Neorhizobium sp. JUb45]|uniref:AsmA family protein n=1 Tax=unclassified Neorhizobium TaxID=2629175 RepID=UPI0010480874|nr:AsmA-like C-terminal region-containing protein [Neorhizobium sp. JUb45]TCR04029.1 AsmA protein [Neorhizobium sp. JUb45]